MARALEIDGLNYDDELLNCLELLFRLRTEELYLHYSKIFSERKIEVLHDTRVAARRLQALFKIFRSLFPQKKFLETYSILKNFIDLLGPVRELDVLSAMLGSYIAKRNINEIKALMLLFANLNYTTLEKRAELFKHPDILNFSDKKNQFLKFYTKYLNKSRKQKLTQLQPLKSFRENAKNIFPFLFDNMFKFKTSVIGQTKNKMKLHRMRIKAKPLRYFMELYLNAFKEDFTKYYIDIKSFVDRTGNVHDMDVLSVKLNKFLKEIRFFNSKQKSRKDNIPTKPIREFLSDIKKKRALNFNKICNQIIKWEEENFKEKVMLNLGIINIPEKQIL
jgi:CHAD domain-containing protein